VYSELEKLRFNKTISKNNQALVTIRCKNTHQFLAHDLAQYLNVAKVIIETTTSNVLEVVCTNANFVKCIRC
jgi:hypothetical protein